jgi:hypothetical protein
MKVAFLFSGQFRKIPLNLLKKSIENLTKNIDYGIFCYSWDEPGESLDHRSHIPKLYQENDSYIQIKKIFTDYNLIELETEPFKDFINKIPRDHKKIIESNKYHKGTIHSLPQIYTLSKCYKLFLPKEKEYDLIFRCRFDSIYIHPLNLYPLNEYANSSYLYNLNFGRAYYPRRVYDIFFGGSKIAMKFLNDIWISIPQLIESKFDNGQDKRDACRLIYLSAKTNNITTKSLRTRICDIYRPIKNDYYEKYIISSHLFSLKMSKYSIKSLKYFIYWIRYRNLNLLRIFFIIILTIFILPLSYLKRIKYFLK